MKVSREKTLEVPVTVKRKTVVKTTVTINVGVQSLVMSEAEAMTVLRRLQFLELPEALGLDSGEEVLDA